MRSERADRMRISSTLSLVGAICCGYIVEQLLTVQRHQDDIVQLRQAIGTAVHQEHGDGRWATASTVDNLSTHHLPLCGILALCMWATNRVTCSDSFPGGAHRSTSATFSDSSSGGAHRSANHYSSRSI